VNLQDRRGNFVIGATPDALDGFELALAQLQCYRGDPLSTIDAALAEAPAFGMARILKAYLGILGTEKPGFEMARGELAALEGITLGERERGHRAALRALVGGDWHGGLAALDRVLADHPRDVLALQAAHVFNFFVGDARNLRDCVGRVRAAWDQSLPGFHAVLGMQAFGLEECGDYAAAEETGHRALELEPHDTWAHHAVAHVLEMQGRIDEGVALMTSRERFWAVESFFAVHNWWHLALYHLERGEPDRALALYDGPIRGARSQVVLDLIDASAMLWRLELRGVDVGPRWGELADAWAPLARDGFYAFNDAHAAMAFLGAGREQTLDELRDTMLAQVSGQVSNAMTREVGLPLVEGLTAFRRGEHARAAELLLRVRRVAQRFGGSHAQRDLIDQTIAEAAVSAGDSALALALASEREQLRRGHPFSRDLSIRARAARGRAPARSRDAGSGLASAAQ
jgi:tetratricopeptide (TPR) repeat protein